MSGWSRVKSALVIVLLIGVAVGGAVGYYLLRNAALEREIRALVAEMGIPSVWELKARKVGEGENSAMIRSDLFFTSHSAALVQSLVSSV